MEIIPESDELDTPVPLDEAVKLPVGYGELLLSLEDERSPETLENMPAVNGPTLEVADGVPGSVPVPVAAVALPAGKGALGDGTMTVTDEVW